MSKTIDALKLALEALEEIAQGASSDFEDAWCGAIAENVLPAIREALAEPSEALMSVSDGAHAPTEREQQPISDVTEAVTKTIIEVEKLLCKKLNKQWTPSEMTIQTLVDELAALAEQPAPVAEPHEQQAGHTFYDGNGNVVAHLDATAEITMDYSKPSAWAQRKPWVGLNDDDLDGYTKSNVLMVRHFERVLFERNTQPCLEGLPEPIRTPPEKGTEYWTIGLGRWTWGGTTHDYSSLGNGIWRCETDVWEVHAAIRRALGIESNIAAVFQNRREAKLRERNEHREKNA